MAAKSNANWQQKLTSALTHDPKKTGVLGLLVAVVVIMIGRWASSHPTPATASAALATAWSGNAAHNTAARSGSAGLKNAKPLTQWLLAPIQPLSRNPFGVKLEYFPQDTTHGPLSAAMTGNEGFWDDLAKSLSNEADQKKERQILLENLRAQAAQLRVQTTMMGAQPKAIVNGELVAEGETIASFKVLRIEPRSLIVEREGVQFEVAMK